MIDSDKNDFWLDRAFAVYDISKAVRYGKNVITLKASPMTVHSELEPVYIFGDFDLEPAKKGWKIVKSTSLNIGGWASQGLPFYSDGISYTSTYHLKPGESRFIVKMNDWLGCVAEVKVNQKSAGIIISQPGELDVTELIREGGNEISIEIYGTLKNLLGPHHNGPLRGSAWPASFQAAAKNMPAGENYDVIEYGLFEPFALLESTGGSQRYYFREYRVAQPIIQAEKNLGVDTPLKVELATSTEGADIYYTLNGQTPTKSSQLYKGPLKISKNAKLQVRAMKKGLKESPVSEKSFYVLNSRINGLKYEYYEGTWEDIPPFNDHQAIHKGRTYDFDLKLLKTRQEKFAVKYSGYIYIAKSGTYDFYINSNDGSKLFISGKELVDNSGSHGPQERQGQLNLPAGLHAIEVHYFDSGGSQLLTVSYQGPGIKKQSVPASILRYQK